MTEDDIEKSAGPQPLLSTWKKLEVELSAEMWKACLPIAIYCSARGLEFDQASQLRSEYTKATTPFTTSPDIRALTEAVIPVDASEAPPPAPPNERKNSRPGPRQVQWKQAPESLRGDITKLVNLFGTLAPSPSRSETAAEAAEKRDASRDEKKRFLLRQIKLAESLRGKKIMRLRELFDEAVLDALEEASFGEKTGRNWQESTTAIFIRSRLLELGVRYAYDVIGDDQLGDMLTAIVDATQKHQKRRATLSAADREASRQLDVPDNTKALTAACRKSAADFKANPSPRRHVAAQCGIGVLLQLGTGRPPFIVRTAKFAGPPRTMPDGEIRPTLVLNDPTLKNMEKDFTAETVAAIDDFWVGAKELRKTDPRALFATRDGTTKSGSAYTLTVQRFCKRNGVTIGPKAIQVGVKRRLISEGHSSQKIAEMVGVQQGANLRERFASVEGANAPQRHADALEKKKREP